MSFELRYCKICIQMTNHIRFNELQWQCKKCGKGNKKDDNLGESEQC